MSDAGAATQAALAVARRRDLRVGDPVVLSDSNNLLLWLRPRSEAAKVGIGHHGRLGLELSVARHLTERGAPIVAPCRDPARAPGRSRPAAQGVDSIPSRPRVSGEPPSSHSGNS
jgi:hypothetical protein